MISFKQKPEGEKPEQTTDKAEDKEEKKESILKKFEVTDSDREDYHNLVDILFVIDTTGSMGWCFQEAKKTILDISSMYTKQEFDIRFALCEYRDHPPQEITFVYQHYDLSNAQKMSQIVESLRAQGGGDGPEAVMDGLYQGLVKTSWRKDDDGTASKRFIFHIGDAPPHGHQYGGQSSDANWQKNGCPCEISLKMLGDQIKEKNIIYNLVECANLSNMVSLFKDQFGENYQETIKIDNSQIQAKSSCIKMSECADYSSKKSSCVGGGGGRFSKPKSYAIPPSLSGASVGESKSESESASSNIFNKQIQANIRKNLS